jgi:hypothetical protein
VHRVAPDRLTFLNELLHTQFDGREDGIRERRAHQAKLIDMFIERLDVVLAIDEKQAALRKRTCHFVRGLGDEIGAEIFRADGQFVAEVEMWRVGGIYYHRQSASLRNTDHRRQVANDPEVVR